MAETILILHQRSLRSDALETGSCATTLTALLIVVSIAWALYGLRFTDTLLVMGFMFGVLFVGFLVFSTVLNFRAGGHFRCMLTTERLVCECPLKNVGESFNLRINEIEFIEEHSSGGDSDSTCYLRNYKGDKFWLTRNYRNPVSKVLDRLEELNPKIEVKRIP